MNVKNKKKVTCFYIRGVNENVLLKRSLFPLLRYVISKSKNGIKIYNIMCYFIITFCHTTFRHSGLLMFTAVVDKVLCSPSVHFEHKITSLSLIVNFAEIELFITRC